MGQPKERKIPLSPVKEVEGSLVDSPNILMMDGVTGEVRNFHERGMNPDAVFNVITGYSESAIKQGLHPIKYFGPIRVGDMYKIFQGEENIGFDTFYVIPTGRWAA